MAGSGTASRDGSVTGQDQTGHDQAASGQGSVPDPAAVAGRERLAEQVARTGMFGTRTTGDTSGYGGLQVRRAPRLASPRPYGSYFDEVADALGQRAGRAGGSASATR